MPRDARTYPVAWPRFALAYATGAVELAVGEWARASDLRPARVTGLLTAMLAQIDGAPVTPDLINRLSVGTREWLVQQLAATCRTGEDWFDCHCPACDNHFDVTVDLATLPRSAAPKGFPLVEIEGHRFEVPNGATETTLADTGATGLDAARLLLRLTCLDDNAGFIDRMDDKDIRKFDATLDQFTPDCADLISAQCPECAAQLAARIDPLAYAFPGEGAVLRDIHTLGRAYQWREVDILAMPTRRRRAYVAMIAADAPQARP